MSDVWELKFEGKSVESGSTVVSDLEFVGVLIKFENLEDLGADIEVTGLFGGLGKVNLAVSCLSWVDLFPEKAYGPSVEAVPSGVCLSVE